MTAKHMQDKKLSRQELPTGSGCPDRRYPSNSPARTAIRNRREKHAAYLTEQDMIIDEGQDSFRPGENVLPVDARGGSWRSQRVSEYTKLGSSPENGQAKPTPLRIFAAPRVAYIECMRRWASAIWSARGSGARLNPARHSCLPYDENKKHCKIIPEGC
jgi:hypothetical protein